ncbi:acyl-CoA dehydrogenase NM domain-like protein [Serendipita vermifera]|nr:acyl-CoA dehydrogenase NM domain-like protein [Serendipita vermifera]
MATQSTTSSSSKIFTRDEVAKHNKKGDLWVIIDSKVFDLSRFANLHPGGITVLLDEEVAGQDATKIFYSLHRHEVLAKPSYARLQIGSIQDEQETIFSHVPGELSVIPYGEPTWLSKGYHSPYFKESHRALQKVFRKFVDEVIYPDAQLCEENGKRFSQSVADAMAAKNIHAMRLGPGKHLKGLTLMDGVVQPEEFDYFHEMVINQEIARIGARGYGDGLMAGMVIGLPPVLNFGSDELKQRIVPDVFAGKKFICLAISEAFAGSDVAGLKTTADKTEDGKHWIVNGTKKWITNGHFADYFTVGCRTDGGFTVILVERGPGVDTQAIKTSYSSTAGTAYVTFDNVKVPVENTLGPENAGLLVMLSNFNHERWVMACSSIRAQRLIVEECMKWVNQREVFGRPLVSQAVIRHKLASMIARCESAQSWLENVTYQMTNMTYKQMSAKLAGQIAFLKMYATRTGQETARDAVQIFGGRGITRTGMGRFIEHYHRTITFDSLLGGAEDVLGDLGVRQAIKQMPKNARL